MRHAVSQRSYVKSIHVVSWFFWNRMNTEGHSDGKFFEPREIPSNPAIWVSVSYFTSFDEVSVSTSASFAHLAVMLELEAP
jgi:hypothetical protein